MCTVALVSKLPIVAGATLSCPRSIMSSNARQVAVT